MIPSKRRLLSHYWCRKGTLAGGGFKESAGKA